MSEGLKCIVLIGLIVIAVVAISRLVSLSVAAEEDRRQRIINLLKQHQELYGHQIINLDPKAGKRGTIYVTLGRMEEEGLLTSREEPGPLPDPEMIPRRLYSLNKHGRRKPVTEIHRQMEFGVA